MNTRDRFLGASAEDALRLKEHFRAVGVTSFYLGWGFPEGGGSYPWDRVTAVSAAGMHRNGVQVGVEFRAEVEGFDFCWTTDIEKSDANGTSGFKVDVDRMARVAALLAPEMRKEFTKVLLGVADAIAEQCAKSMKWIENQYAQEGALRALARSSQGKEASRGTALGACDGCSGRRCVCGVTA